MSETNTVPNAAPLPKPAPAPLSAAQETAAWVYRIGLREMGPLIFRLITTEATVREQAIQIAALQSAVLKHGK